MADDDRSGIEFEIKWSINLGGILAIIGAVGLVLIALRMLP